MNIQQIGPLRCYVVDGSDTPTIPVILCHGYGAPGHDLASLSSHLIEMIGPASAHFRFVFPEAPSDLSELGMPEGRAWWPLNMMALQELLQTNRFSELHDQQPPGIDHARDQLAATVQAVLDGMPPSDSTSGSVDSDSGSDGAPSEVSKPYVIGGFSQGAMLTLDLALRGPLPPPNILIQFSGTLICQSEWAKALPRLQKTLVLQSHGRIDPILPFSSAEALRDFLKSGDINVEFVPFHGPHTIHTDMLIRVVERLRVLPENLR